jgi:hypothetical protein
MVKGKVHGIKMGINNQLLTQYDDDTSFSLEGEKLNVKKVLEPLIHCFMEIVSLEIYRGKNVMHWRVVQQFYLHCLLRYY